jgi:hypothetical protein
MTTLPAPDTGARDRAPDLDRDLAPDPVAGDTDGLVSFHEDLARAEALEREQRRREAEIIGLKSRISDVENRHIALLRSTSWRLGARLRGLLPGKGGAPDSEPFEPRFRKYRAPGQVVSRSPEKVERLLASARAGFPEAALADLARLRDNWKAKPEVRALAERAMVLIEGESGDPAVRARAIARLDAPRHWGTRAGDGEEIAFLRRAIADTLPGARGNRPDRFAVNGWLIPDIALLGGAAGTDPAARIAEISGALEALSRVDLIRADPSGPARLDNLAASRPAGSVGGPKVSVILVAERRDRLATALGSLQAQSWGDLEILVVDDATTDGAAEVIAGAAAADPRVVVLRAEQPVGLYAARNMALARATGDLVACLDATAWAHPARIERQARYLLAQKSAIATRGGRLRTTEDLRFQRPPYATTLVEADPTGLLFRRAPVLERAGFWDAVALGGDAEFAARLAAIFGEGALTRHKSPLTFARAEENTPEITLDRGAGRAYARLYRERHKALTGEGAEPAAARVAWPPEGPRPFATPSRILTGQPRRGAHYDAILISDFRHVGGTTASNHQELLAQVQAGVKTAVVQVDRYGYDVDRGVNAGIQELIDAAQIDELVEGDAASADVAVIRFPAIFAEPQRYLPVIRTGALRVVVNQTPRRMAGEAPFYDIHAARRNVADWLGQRGDWVPIGPQVRDGLTLDGDGDLLTAENWFNIIDVDAWEVARPDWQDSRPVIGRHGRDAIEKWPTKAAAIRAAYPDDGTMRVRVLGGASIPEKILGTKLRTWEVLPFNSVHPRDFLASLDFFVFFPHEERIEAFGRTIIEAMASGCLTILPHVFEPLFGETALYCEPEEAQALVKRYFADRAAYLAHTERASQIVRERFGYEQHITRLRRAMRSASQPVAGE